MRTTRSLRALVLLLAVGVLLIVGAANLQAIEDWVKLQGYTPPANVAKLASADTMTDKAKHLFYLNHPRLIDDKNQFRQACPQNEQTIVLGCYHSVQDGIAVFDVSDPRLDGVEEVTAAHEMLHAAYDRLSSANKKHVDSLLLDYYKGLSDKRIQANINAYKKTEPNDVVNEMHSIFGTEIAQLPGPLEDYYRQYFTNRQAVAGFSNQYKSVFTQNRQQLQSLKQQIDALKSQLNSDKQTIQNEQDALAAQRRHMNELLAAHKTDEYNSLVDPYNAKVVNLRTLVASYNATVAKVNDLVEQYNSLAYTQESLYQAIDTRVQTQPAQ